MNFILIVSDTFRRDHLGCYGDKTIRTPHIDRFAEKCVQFENCCATSFPTMPNRADLFTGKFTFTYMGWEPLSRKEKILAEIFRKAGYRTLAVVDTPFFVRNGYGYDRGFEDFIWISGQRPRSVERSRFNYERRYEEDLFAPRTMLSAEKVLERYCKERFFLYIDTWDPHEPWNSPNWYVEPYCRGYTGEPAVSPCYANWREYGLKEEDIQLAHACYRGEISMVDLWVGRFLDKAKTMGLLDNTVIVFTSDHGFYFGEHGYFGKACRGKKPEEKKIWYRSPLYKELTQIPLLVYGPDLEAGRSEAIVCSVDLMPALLELAGIEIPKGVQGSSFVSILKEKKSTFRDFAVTSWPLYNPGERTRAVDDWLRVVKEPQPSTITTKKWTLLYSLEEHPVELYDMEWDPNQSQNVINKNWEVAKDLHRRFVGLLENTGTDAHLLTPRKKLSKV